MDLLFGVIGGDRRQAELLKLLRQDGYQAAAYGTAGETDWERAVSAEVVLLPLPLCREGDTINIEGEQRGIGALLRQMRRNQLLLAGQVKPAQTAEAAELDLNLIDYFKREELTVANAAATAEGTVQVILERLGALAAGEPLSGTGLWAYRQAAVSPPERYGGKCHGGGQTPGVSGLGRGLWL